MKIAASQKAKYAPGNEEKEHASGLSTGGSSVSIPQKTTDTARSLGISIIGTGDKRQMNEELLSKSVYTRNICNLNILFVNYCKLLR